jgi:hypothetical protein
MFRIKNQSEKSACICMVIPEGLQNSDLQLFLQTVDNFITKFRLMSGFGTTCWLLQSLRLLDRGVGLIEKAPRTFDRNCNYALHAHESGFDGSYSRSLEDRDNPAAVHPNLPQLAPKVPQINR